MTAMFIDPASAGFAHAYIHSPKQTRFEYGLGGLTIPDQSDCLYQDSKKKNEHLELPPKKWNCWTSENHWGKTHHLYLGNTLPDLFQFFCIPSGNQTWQLETIYKCGCHGKINGLV